MYQEFIMNRILHAFAVTSVLALPFAMAQAGESLQAPTSRPGPMPGGIAWFGTWKQGAAEAKRTGKPILLMSAAPQCHNVPGVW